MNVAFDPWVPVVTLDGKRQLVSLSDVFKNGTNYADLAVRPHERVSLMRLFLCVAHAALEGPKDYDEWFLVPERLPIAAEAYLIKWRDSFELFHPQKPWLQVAEITKDGANKKNHTEISDWTPVSKLNFSYATGNNTTFFDHQGSSNERKIFIEETLLSMLSFQCFSTGGLIAQVFWNGQKSQKTSKDSPCVSSSMIHAFLRGNQIGATIHLNLPTHEDIRFSYGERPIGHPVWEMMPSSFADSPCMKNATETYIGRLVPLTRLIHLHPGGERMLLGDGLPYLTFQDGFPPEPTATVVVRQFKKKESRNLLKYNPEKALWRELSALLVMRKADGLGGPLSLRSIRVGENCDLIVSALARSQATIVDTKESVFHIPSRLRSDRGTASYEAGVKNAEALANRLGWAIEGYRSEIDNGWEGRLKSAGSNKGTLKYKLHALATTNYWTTVEKNLPLLMAHIEAIDSAEAIPTQKRWQKMLFSTTCDAFRTVCGQETPRQIRAFAKGWRRLVSKINEQESNTLEIIEEEA